MRQRARPWQAREIVAAGELRDLVLEVLVHRADELASMNRQLARSNEELEAFACVASHDIREPLRQIETFASMLERGTGGGGTADPIRVQGWIQGIETSSRRLRTLIDDLTEFSRLGRHTQPFSRSPLGELLVEAESDLAQMIADSGCAILAPAELPSAWCDRGQMRRVLQNLLSNALKYREPERPGVIRIEAALESAGGSPRRRPMLRITVTDNGIGFEQHHAERIFEPFQRLHSVDRFPGSGIGLAICRKIIERHGGQIGAVATPDQGAVFWFTLPAAVAEDGGGSPQPGEPAP